MAVAYWSEDLSRDVASEEDKQLEKLMEIEYARFAESVIGHRPTAPSFCDNYWPSCLSCCTAYSPASAIAAIGCC